MLPFSFTFWLIHKHNKTSDRNPFKWTSIWRIQFTFIQHNHEYCYPESTISSSNVANNTCEIVFSSDSSASWWAGTSFQCAFIIECRVDSKLKCLPWWAVEYSQVEWTIRVCLQFRLFRLSGSHSCQSCVRDIFKTLSHIEYIHVIF